MNLSSSSLVWAFKRTVVSTFHFLLRLCNNCDGFALHAIVYICRLFKVFGRLRGRFFSFHPNMFFIISTMPKKMTSVPMRVDNVFSGSLFAKMDEIIAPTIPPMAARASAVNENGMK